MILFGNRLGKLSRWLVPGLLALCMAASADTPVFASDNTWILVDTVAMRLSVMQGDSIRQTYSNISIGRGGVATLKKRHDGTTPLGEFRISRMTTDTPFHRFIGIDYPNLQQAEAALRSGLISQSEYAAIRGAFSSKRLPPQNTPLGGYIGIHGVGQGAAAIHEDFNWTNGCIALTNAQLDDLSSWVYIGMKVVIRH
jgi:murein L,D-transpeptidase YafK